MQSTAPYPTPTPPPLDLPGLSWVEGQQLTAAGGNKLRRWGSVKKASEMLDGCDREVIYDLIAVGRVKAYKLRPHRVNSHWKVDLLGVWEHKQRQLHERRTSNVEH
jgi:hypothetical protein